MPTGPSRKELRRQAALQERDRRSCEDEAANLERSANVDWGTASLLLDRTRANIIRLGGSPRSPKSRNPIEILTDEIKWPPGRFRSSSALFRELESDPSFDLLDETSLQDAMPVRCLDFQFIGHDDATELHDVLRLDTHSFHAIGRDCHSYFLIGRNPNQMTDPLLYHVDQQATDEPPFQPENVTIGWLLAVLATA